MAVPGDEQGLLDALVRAGVLAAAPSGGLAGLRGQVAAGALDLARLARWLGDEGVPPVCEGCGHAASGPEAAASAACERCGAALEHAARLTTVDVLLAERPQDLAPGRPVRHGGGGVGRYRAEGELGRGGMGVVFRARDESLGREVALKVIRTGKGDDNRRAQRFIREGRMLAQLDHPGIVRVFDAGRHRDRAYLAMELLRGRSLRDLAKEGGLTLPRALDALEDVARALEVVHARGIVHRDLKLANIVLGEDGRARLIDFGLAQEGDRTGMLTTAGLVVGTIHSLAPEQVEGRRDLDGRTDVYALGVALYQVLFGRWPFTGRTPIEVAHAILRGAPPRARKDGAPVPSALLAVALEAMARDPGDRPASALAFAERLRQARAALDGGAAVDLDSASSQAALDAVPRGRARAAARGSRSLPGGAGAPPPRGGAGPWLALGGALAAVAIAGAAYALRARPGPRGARAGSAADRAEAGARSPSPAPSPVTDRAAVHPEAALLARALAERDDAGRGEPAAGAPETSAPATSAPAPTRPAPTPPAPAASEPARAPEPAIEPDAEPATEPIVEPVATAGAEPAAGPAPAPAGPAPALGRSEWQVRALAALALGGAADGGAADDRETSLAARRAAVRGLAGLAGDKEALVRLVALEALAGFDADLVREVGGRPLGEALMVGGAGWAGGGPLALAANRLAERMGGPASLAWLAALGPGAALDPAAPPAAAPGLAEALARGERLAKLDRRGLEVCIALDVTSSMADEVLLLSTDLPLLGEALARLTGEARVGLVTYGNRLLVTAPLDDRPARLAEVGRALALEEDPTNTTIEEAVPSGVEGALHKRLGWRRKADRVVIVVGDAPAPEADRDALLDLVAAARREGFRVSSLIAEPPAKYAARANPTPMLTEVAARGGGAALPLAAGERPLVKLVALALDEPLEALAPLVEAWLRLRAAEPPRSRER